MGIVPTWAVATAVLLEEGLELHVNEITSRVLATQLSDLCEKGKTPEKTLGTILRKPEFAGGIQFNLTGEGHYSLRNPELARQKRDVIFALQMLQKPARQSV